MMYTFAAELFPTEVRSVGVGFCVFVGRLGSILAPFVLRLAAALRVSQMIFYAAFGIVGAVAVYFLPETAGKQLKDRLEDSDNDEDENNQSIVDDSIEDPP